MTEQDNPKYNADHLTTDEVKAICVAIKDQLYVSNTPDQLVHTDDFEELGDEYDFWVTELEKRLRAEET